jgi:hypothetical protein
MNQNTIRRIPEHVADKLLQEIAKLEGDQDGPAEDSPLAIESAS